jgi:hypothetical protein
MLYKWLISQENQMPDICLAFFTIDTPNKITQHLIFKTACKTVWQTVYDETNSLHMAIRDSRLTSLKLWDTIPEERMETFASAVCIIPDTPLCEETEDRLLLVQWENRAIQVY